MYKLWPIFVSSTFCLALCGCSKSVQTDPRVHVSGVVLIDGKPLDSGLIRFVPANGRPVSGAIHKGGAFRLREYSVSHQRKGLDVLPGWYRVSVSANEIVNAKKDEVRWLAPSRYADFRSSGIEVEVDSAESDLRIELTWEGNEPVVEKPKKGSLASVKGTAGGREAQESDRYIEQKELLKK